MGKRIKVVVECEGKEHDFLWVGLQDDGSVSLGFTDRAFWMPGFIEELKLKESVHISHVNLKEKHQPDAIKNPHFTFHPPMYVHLRSNGQEELFAGLLGIDMIVEESGRFSWIRFISNPIDQLKEVSPGRGTEPTDKVTIRSASKKESIELSVDFVGALEELPKEDYFFIHPLEWQGRKLQLFAKCCEGQPATFCWNHES